MKSIFMPLFAAFAMSAVLRLVFLPSNIMRETFSKGIFYIILPCSFNTNEFALSPRNTPLLAICKVESSANFLA